MKFTNLLFAPLLLLFLFLGFNKPVVAQEEEPVYTDTVDLFEFYIYALKNDTAKFWDSKNQEFSLDSAVIIGTDNNYYEDLLKIEGIDSLVFPKSLSIKNSQYIVRYYESQNYKEQTGLKLNNIKCKGSLYFINIKFLDIKFRFSNATRIELRNSKVYGGLYFRELSNGSVFISQSEIKNGLNFNEFKNCTFIIKNSTVYGKFEGYHVDNIENNNPINITQNKFIGTHYDTVNIEKENKKVNWYFNSFKFRSGEYLSSVSDSISSLEEKLISNRQINIGSPTNLVGSHIFNVNTFKFIGNEIGNSNNDLCLLGGNIKNFEFKENWGNACVEFNGLNIEDELTFSENNLQCYVFSKVIFSEMKNFIPFDQFFGNKLKFKTTPFDLLKDTTKGYFNRGDFFLKKKAEHPLIFGNNYSQKRSKEIYAFLYENSKKNGDQESANACYAEMKQVETRRWKYLYSQNPTFETYFRWKLNVFLNYFTDYGTNPAKAVVKSLWVILIFAIFYLFFPSDWDVTNRAEFLKRWKELLRGRTKEQRQKSPFSFFLSSLFFIIYTGFIHLLNALTLSLNAFTTLGFGDIPTHGAARYVTIVQGFIGWFLLTIFSVSLINQVLG